jgi:uncharacterized protein
MTTENIPIAHEDFYPRLGQAILLCLALFAMHVCVIFPIMILKHLVGLEESIGRPATQLFAFSLILRWAGKKINQTTREVFPLSSFQLEIILPMIILLIGIKIISSEVGNVLEYFLPKPLFLIEIEKEVFGSGFSSIILCVVVAPLTEELLFRGIILRGFQFHYGKWKAIFLSAVLFSLFHLNPYQFFSAFIGGLILGWLFLETGSLMPCIIAHAFFNSIGFIASNLFPGIPGFTTALVNTHISFQPAWLDISGVICIIAGMIIFSKIPVNSRVVYEHLNAIDQQSQEAD